MHKTRTFRRSWQYLLGLTILTILAFIAFKWVHGPLLLTVSILLLSAICFFFMREVGWFLFFFGIVAASQVNPITPHHLAVLDLPSILLGGTGFVLGGGLGWLVRVLLTPKRSY